MTWESHDDGERCTWCCRMAQKCSGGTRKRERSLPPVNDRLRGLGSYQKSRPDRSDTARQEVGCKWWHYMTPEPLWTTGLWWWNVIWTCAGFIATTFARLQCKITVNVASCFTKFAWETIKNENWDKLRKLFTYRLRRFSPLLRKNYVWIARSLR